MNAVAFVALGSNLGDSQAVILDAMERLQELSRTDIVRSSLWRSSPVNCPPGSPDFINAAVALTPKLPTPEELLNQLQQFERDFGRSPKVVMNEARPLDLDLIAWGDLRVETERLILPHPRAHLRKFVLAPLVEIAPDLVLPGQLRSVTDQLRALHTEERIALIRP